MSVTVSRQAAEFLWAALTGFGLGILYDLGRALRREKRGLTIPVDMLFAAAFFLCLVLTAIYSQGLRLYQCLGMFLGAGLWFLTLGPWFVDLCRRVLRMLGRAAGTARAGLRKSMYFLRKTAKKLFPFERKWSTI